VKLAEYQRAVIAGSFSAEGSPEGERALGNPERFRLYRHRIRTRLQGMAHVAFKQTLTLLGESAFGASFERYLAAEPPRSPLIRDVVARFAGFARNDAALHVDAPFWLDDLLSFEESKWRLAYQPCLRPKVGQDGVHELSFEGAPVLNPVLQLLSLRAPVHTLHENAALTNAATELLIYRPDGSDEVRWYVTDALFAGIVRRAASGESLASLVRAEAAQQRRVLDEALLESLASSVTLALQRGVLVGVR
jgi:hypothetical protein